MASKFAGTISLGLLGIGLGADYYGTTYYKSFDADECHTYQIDARAVGKPGVLVGSAMSESANALTVMYPRNGMIVKARPVENSEGWLQLLSGSYTQMRHCGVTMIREVPEPEGMGNRNWVWGKLPAEEEVIDTLIPPALRKKQEELAQAAALAAENNAKAGEFGSLSAPTAAA